MQIAIVLYPGFTSLDALGPYEVFGRLPDSEVVFVAENPGVVVNDLQSLSVNVLTTIDDVMKPDVVLIGGGPGQANQMTDGKLHEWLRTVDQTATWMTSVCTGSLVLAATGLLRGREATSHWLAMDELANYGAIPSKRRVVIDGHYATAAGVSAGIDLALTLGGRLVGDEAAQTVQLIIEYSPEPPYNSGSVDSAPAAIIDNAKSRLSKRFQDG